LEVDELPSEETFVRIFLAARTIAAKVRQRPDFTVISAGNRRAAFPSRTYKTMCYSLVNSFLRKAPMAIVGHAAQQLDPSLTDAGFALVYPTLEKEFANLLDLIVYEKADFFRFYNEHFQSGANKWQ
jgi:hypothetical protein